MNPTTPSRPFLLASCFLASLAFGFSGELPAKESLPEVSPEGMHLQKSQDARIVYVKPGATLDKYDRVAIIDTYVEFADNWQRDYNNSVAGVQGRVTTEDMDRMKAAMAAEFKKVFTEELQTKGGYEVVETAAPDVLVLRPAIINLKPTAPDLKTADARRTLVASAGQMTLYLELWDAASNTILARIMDPQADERMGGMARISNSASNKAAVDTILKKWAEKLRKHLDAARGKPAGT